MNQFIVSVRIGILGLDAVGEVPTATTYVPVKAENGERALQAAVRWFGDNSPVDENDQHQWFVDDVARKTRYTATKYVPVSDIELHDFLSVTQGVSTAIVVIDTPEHVEQKQVALLKLKIQYWQDNLLDVRTGKAPFSDKRNMLGRLINDDSRWSVLVYLREPSVANWADIRNIMITPTQTIWQMIIDMNPQTPSSGNGFTPENIPTESELTDMLCRAVKQYNDHCRSNIRECQKQLAKLEALPGV